MFELYEVKIDNIKGYNSSENYAITIKICMNEYHNSKPFWNGLFKYYNM